MPIATIDLPPFNRGIYRAASTRARNGSTPCLSFAERSIHYRRIAELESVFSDESQALVPRSAHSAHSAHSLLDNDTTLSRGRPLSLLLPYPGDTNITIAQFLSQRARDGHILKTSCALAGVSLQAVRLWLRRGREIATLIDAGELAIASLDTNSSDLVYYQFYLDYSASESEHISELEKETVTVALTGKQTTRYKEMILTDPITGEVIDRVEVIDSRTVTRDATTARELLAAYAPDEYAPPKQLKLTGTGTGGEIEINTSSSINFRALIEVATLEEQVVLHDLIEALSTRLAQQRTIDVTPTTSTSEEQ